MSFIYEPDELAVVPMRVNGHEGVSVQLEADMMDFGTDNYIGDDLLFESREVALAWARRLVAELESVQ